jgi:hypothetical protein
MAVLLTPGQAGDNPRLLAVLEGICAHAPSSERLLRLVVEVTPRQRTTSAWYHSSRVTPLPAAADRTGKVLRAWLGKRFRD